MIFICKCNRTFKSKRALGVHKTYCEIFLGHVSPLLAIRSRDSKSYRAKPEVKEKYSKIMTKLNSDPEFKKKMKKVARETILKRLNDPDEKAKIVATLASNSQSEEGRRRAAHLMIDNHNKFEFNFHQNYKNYSIGGEYYPLELTENFNKIFTDYNRQKILPF